MAILLQINKLNYQITDDKIFNISLDIQRGEYISIIAPNKSGKTIFKCEEIIQSCMRNFNQII